MSAVTAGRRRRRRWWLPAIVVAVVAAAVAGGVWWSTGRDTTGEVTYLTATVSTGTISDTVESDFTLASDGGVSAISLPGSSSSSTSTGSAGGTTGATTGSSGSAAATTVFASCEAGSPSPSPTSSAGVEPTSTPTPSGSPTVRPSPSGSSVPVPTPSQSSGGSFSGGSGGAAVNGGSASSSGTSGGSATTSTSVSSGLSGIVTRLVAKEGAAPRTLQRLLTVSGKDVFAFVSPAPLWKDLSTGLSSGEQRANVAVLQRALTDEGFYHGRVSGTFTSATATGYRKWQAAHGMSRTGVVDVDRFVWMPDGSTLSSWSVTLGSRVGGGTQLATISAPSALTAQALVGQSDLGRLEVGQKAEMTIDGYTDQAFTGVITAISDEPASSVSSMSGSSSGSTQYTVTIVPQDLPSVARSGMTGTLEIVLQEHGDVLLVPTSAVTGTSGTSYVRVMQDGVPVVRQVETGMTTSSYTEVTSGLVEGETVVTGQYVEGASSGTSAGDSQRSGLGSVLNGAGGPPAGGMPQGAPPMMQGGGQ